MFIYVGNSDFASGPGGRSPEDKVTVFDYDPATGKATELQTVDGLRNPTYMVRHPTLPVLYVLERWVNPDRSKPTPPENKTLQAEGDAVAAFKIDTAKGTLTPLGRASTGGQSTMHINLHPNGRYAFFANPGLPEDPNPEKAHVAVMRLGPDGAPGEICSSAVYPWESPVWRKNRPKPYPHSVWGNPDWTGIFVCNLVSDRVTMYRFDEATAALTLNEQPYAQLASGSGPRHMAFHPSGKFFFVLTEYDSTIVVFAYNEATRLASVVQSITMHEGTTGKKSAAHVLVGPGGQYLYASNRSQRTIVVYKIDQETGELSTVAHQPAEGKRPRDFIFDPSGKLFALANQDSGEVVMFNVDAATGNLVPTGHHIPSKHANCVVFGA